MDNERFFQNRFYYNHQINPQVGQQQPWQTAPGWHHRGNNRLQPHFNQDYSNRWQGRPRRSYRFESWNNNHLDDIYMPNDEHSSLPREQRHLEYERLMSSSAPFSKKNQRPYGYRGGHSYHRPYHSHQQYNQRRENHQNPANYNNNNDADEKIDSPPSISSVAAEAPKAVEEETVRERGVIDMEIDDVDEYVVVSEVEDEEDEIQTCKKGEEIVPEEEIQCQQEVVVETTAEEEKSTKKQTEEDIGEIFLRKLMECPNTPPKKNVEKRYPSPDLTAFEMGLDTSKSYLRRRRTPKKMASGESSVFSRLFDGEPPVDIVSRSSRPAEETTTATTSSSVSIPERVSSQEPKNTSEKDKERKLSDDKSLDTGLVQTLRGKVERRRSRTKTPERNHFDCVEALLRDMELHVSPVRKVPTQQKKSKDPKDSSAPKNDLSHKKKIDARRKSCGEKSKAKSDTKNVKSVEETPGFSGLLPLETPPHTDERKNTPSPSEASTSVDVRKLQKNADSDKSDSAHKKIGARRKSCGEKSKTKSETRNEKPVEETPSRLFRLQTPPLTDEIENATPSPSEPSTSVDVRKSQKKTDSDSLAPKSDSSHKKQTGARRKSCGEKTKSETRNEKTDHQQDSVRKISSAIASVEETPESSRLFQLKTPPLTDERENRTPSPLAPKSDSSHKKKIGTRRKSSSDKSKAKNVTRNEKSNQPDCVDKVSSATGSVEEKPGPSRLYLFETPPHTVEGNNTTPSLSEASKPDGSTIKSDSSNKIDARRKSCGDKSKEKSLVKNLTEVASRKKSIESNQKEERPGPSGLCRLEKPPRTEESKKAKTPLVTNSFEERRNKKTKSSIQRHTSSGEKTKTDTGKLSSDYKIPKSKKPKNREMSIADIQNLNASLDALFNEVDVTEISFHEYEQPDLPSREDDEVANIISSSRSRPSRRLRSKSLTHLVLQSDTSRRQSRSMERSKTPAPRAKSVDAHSLLIYTDFRVTRSMSKTLGMNNGLNIATRGDTYENVVSSMSVEQAMEEPIEEPMEEPIEEPIEETQELVSEVEYSVCEEVGQQHRMDKSLEDLLVAAGESSVRTRRDFTETVPYRPPVQIDLCAAVPVKVYRELNISDPRRHYKKMVSLESLMNSQEEQQGKTSKRRHETEPSRKKVSRTKKDDDPDYKPHTHIQVGSRSTAIQAIADTTMMIDIPEKRTPVKRRIEQHEDVSVKRKTPNKTRDICLDDALAMMPPGTSNEETMTLTVSHTVHYAAQSTEVFRSESHLIKQLNIPKRPRATVSYPQEHQCATVSQVTTHRGEVAKSKSSVDVDALTQELLNCFAMSSVFVDVSSKAMGDASFSRKVKELDKKILESVVRVCGKMAGSNVEIDDSRRFFKTLKARMIRMQTTPAVDLLVSNGDWIKLLEDVDGIRRKDLTGVQTPPSSASSIRSEDDVIFIDDGNHHTPPNTSFSTKSTPDLQQSQHTITNNELIAASLSAMSETVVPTSLPTIITNTALTTSVSKPATTTVVQKAPSVVTVTPNQSDILPRLATPLIASTVVSSAPSSITSSIASSAPSSIASSAPSSIAFSVVSSVASSVVSNTVNQTKRITASSTATIPTGQPSNDRFRAIASMPNLQQKHSNVQQPPQRPNVTTQQSTNKKNCPPPPKRGFRLSVFTPSQRETFLWQVEKYKEITNSLREQLRNNQRSRVPPRRDQQVGVQNVPRPLNVLTPNTINATVSKPGPVQARSWTLPVENNITDSSPATRKLRELVTNLVALPKNSQDLALRQMDKVLKGTTSNRKQTGKTSKTPQSANTQLCGLTLSGLLEGTPCQALPSSSAQSNAINTLLSDVRIQQVVDHLSSGPIRSSDNTFVQNKDLTQRLTETTPTPQNHGGRTPDVQALMAVRINRIAQRADVTKRTPPLPQTPPSANSAPNTPQSPVSTSSRAETVPLVETSPSFVTMNPPRASSAETMVDNTSSVELKSPDEPINIDEFLMMKADAEEAVVRASVPREFVDAEEYIQQNMQPDDPLPRNLSVDSGVFSPAYSQIGGVDEEDSKCQTCSAMALFLCSCQTAKYCSVNCQSSDWAVHKEMHDKIARESSRT